MSRGVDIGALMKQAQALQENVAKAQAELVNVRCEGRAGGNMVTATVNGNFDLVALTLDKAVVDPNDVGMLQDLIIAATNQAAAKVREETKKKMAGVVGGAGIPGLPGLF